MSINVLLIREHYADGHCQEWALMSTGEYVDPPQARTYYHCGVKIEERHRQVKCFHDLSNFRSGAQNVIVAQVVLILLSYTLRQWQLWPLQEEVAADKTPEFMGRRLNLRKQYIVIYPGRSYARIPLVQFTRLVLELEGEVRQSGAGQDSETGAKPFELNRRHFLSVSGHVRLAVSCFS